MVKEFTEDFLGNVIKVGDEVIYIAQSMGYYLDDSDIRIVQAIADNGNVIIGDKNYKREIKRFVKVVRESK